MPRYDFNQTTYDTFELPTIICEGTRDETIFKYACSLQAKGASDDEIEMAAQAANAERCRPPLPESTVRSKVRSALTYAKGVVGFTPPRNVGKVFDTGYAEQKVETVTADVLPDLSDMTPAEQATAYIGAVFEPEDLVCLSRNLRCVEDDLYHYAGTLTGKVVGVDMWPGILPFVDDHGAWVCVNPLTDYHRDRAHVAAYRNVLVECDTMPMDEQLERILSLWWGHDYLRAIVDSGNKSYHAIIRVDAPTVENYAYQAGRLIYDRAEANGLTVDRACSNPTRMTRLAGALRRDTGRMQRLVWAYGV